MKMKIIDADEMGVSLTYSNGDIVEVEYNVSNEEYRDMEEPFVYHAEWDGKYFELIEEQSSEYTGEGLPPVGTDIEWCCESFTLSKGWHKGFVIAYYKDRCWLTTDTECKEHVLNINQVTFRPTKSLIISCTRGLNYGSGY